MVADREPEDHGRRHEHRPEMLAALRAGITTVMLPARNRRDLEEIPAEAREQLAFVWLENVDEAVEAALAGNAGGRQA